MQSSLRKNKTVFSNFLELNFCTSRQLWDRPTLRKLGHSVPFVTEASKKNNATLFIERINTKSIPAPEMYSRM
jgi:hypothetical protein